MRKPLLQAAGIHSEQRARSGRPLRWLFIVPGWTVMCCCATPEAAAQAVSTGPSYYADALYPGVFYKVGANGAKGTDATTPGGKCDGPYPGTAGSPGGAVSGSVAYAPTTSPFKGTIVVAGSTGGTGGAGGNSDRSPGSPRRRSIAGPARSPGR